MSEVYGDWDQIEETFPLNANCFLPEVLVSINEYVYLHSNFTIQQYRKGQFGFLSRCLKKDGAYNVDAMLIYEGKPPTPTLENASLIINEYVNDILTSTADKKWNDDLVSLFCPSWLHPEPKTELDHGGDYNAKTPNRMTSQNGLQANSRKETFWLFPWAVYPLGLVALVISSITIYCCYKHMDK